MKNETVADLRKEARAMSLVYTPDSIPGYTRKLSGKSFVFFDTQGKRISDKEEIKRIRGLVLPPAWEKVWICPKPNGHLQATGYDIAGKGTANSDSLRNAIIMGLDIVKNRKEWREMTANPVERVAVEKE